MQPLRGIRVLDFSKVLAGPTCTQALADMGASVIKVEDCRGGDDTRAWPPFREGKGTVFLAANRGKRSIALNLKDEEGRRIARELARRADVIVESYGYGVVERLGIDYDSLRADNPRLVYCSISGFGRIGPLADGKGYDMMLQAFGGIVSITGEPGGGPVRAPFSPVDQGTGMHAVSGILCALLNREQTGAGALVEISLYETTLSFMGYMLQGYWARGTEPAKYGCSHESVCPYEAFSASDKRILIGVANDKLWRALCKLMDFKGLADDPRFATNAARVAHRAETLAMVQNVVSTKTCDEWAALLTAAGIPCSPINNLGDVSRHPQTAALGIVGETRGAHGESNPFVKSPLRFDGERNVDYTAPPALGEHTREILSELGRSPAQVDALMAAGTVAEPAPQAA